MAISESEFLRVCPECASAMTECSGLVGGSASCGACGWKGKREDMLTVPFAAQMGNPTELFITMRNDLRSLVSVNATHFLRFLVKWGFIPAVQRGDKIEILTTTWATRYMNVIARGVLLAVIEERQKIEKERVDA